MQENHSIPTGAHLEVAKTYSHLHANVTWDGMKKDTSDFIVKCTVCQQSKPSSSPYRTVATN